jgi:hypothetical protein
MPTNKQGYLLGDSLIGSFASDDLAVSSATAIAADDYTIADYPDITDPYDANGIEQLTSGLVQHFSKQWHLNDDWAKFVFDDDKYRKYKRWNVDRIYDVKPSSSKYRRFL